MSVGGRKMNNHLKICMDYLSAQWKFSQGFIIGLVKRCGTFMVFLFLLLLHLNLILYVGIFGDSDV